MAMEMLVVCSIVETQTFRKTIRFIVKKAKSKDSDMLSACMPFAWAEDHWL